VLGSLGLDDRRKALFHRAIEKERDGIEGFVVCEPIYRTQWLLPRCDAAQARRHAWNDGTSDREILRLLRKRVRDGVNGTCAARALDDPDLLDHPVLARLMRFVYERVNINYDFKLLYRYKAKYHPHTWEPRYFCFNQRRFAQHAVRGDSGSQCAHSRDAARAKRFSGKVQDMETRCLIHRWILLGWLSSSS
jgi:hypothetical protein